MILINRELTKMEKIHKGRVNVTQVDSMVLQISLTVRYQTLYYYKGLMIQLSYCTRLKDEIHFLIWED